MSLCVYVDVCHLSVGTHGDQKMAGDLLELELSMIVSCMTGSCDQNSGLLVEHTTLNHWATSPDPTF